MKCERLDIQASGQWTASPLMTFDNFDQLMRFLDLIISFIREEKEKKYSMSIWKVEDHTEANKGCLRLTCDGKMVCYFFPFAADIADPDWVKIQAFRIRDRMQGSRLVRVDPTDAGSVT